MRSMFNNDDSLELRRGGLFFNDELSMTTEEAGRLNALLLRDDLRSQQQSDNSLTEEQDDPSTDGFPLIKPTSGLEAALNLF